MFSRKNFYNVITITFIVMILLPVKSFCAEEKETSEILEQARRNIEKYRKGDAMITFKTLEGKAVDGAEIVIEQTSQDFLFGNIIFPVVGVLGKFEDIDVYRPELFKKRFKDLFNMAIFPFYWSSYEVVPGREKWDRIVPILDWCKLNGITAKGHPLAWVESGGTPRWLYDLPVELTEDLLKARIIRNTKGFKGQIDLWDVVNEPTHTITWSSVMKEPYGVRYTSIPVNEIAEWLESCFRWAHEGNHQAELVINDYEQIVSNFIPDTRERFYKLVEELQKRGTPLHGVGLQAHEPRSEWYSPSEFLETLDYYAQLGYPLHITEFVAESSGEKINGFKEGTWTLQAQAEYAEQIYVQSFGHPSVKSINWWGLSDRYIWQERPSGGLIDENYNPKPVYTKLHKLIKNEWMTSTSGRTDEDGSIDFRGFYGRYKIVLKAKEGTIHTFEIHLDKGEENRWEFHL